MSFRRRLFLTGLVIWAAVALLEATVITLQGNVSFFYALLPASLSFAILGLLAIPLWRFCSWLQERRGSRLGAGLWHLLALLVSVTLWQGLLVFCLYFLVGREAIRYLMSAGLWYLIGVVMIYGLLLAAILLTQTQHHLERQKRRADELLLLAREAEIRALRSQLRPHFMFNVLNSLYALIEVEPKEALRMVDRLGDLMRRTLEATDEVVPLSWELETIRSYLGIEQIRIGPRLVVREDIDNEVAEALVPPLLLQPLVENAIKHAVAPIPGSAEILITGRRSDNDLHLSVRDSGPGMGGSEPENGGGQGLAITRRRLVALYGDVARLDLLDIKPGGFEALVRLPLDFGELGDKADV